MEKHTYIKRDIDGYFIEFDEQFNPELYNNIGTTYQDFVNNLWVLLSDEQVAFHEENPEANVKEVWYMRFDPEPERTLEDAKAEMIRRITLYDSSINVNEFKVNNRIRGWFTADERNNYKCSIDAAETVGIEKVSFFIGDTLFELNIETAKQMLARLQLYADSCFIVTKQHKLAINELDTIEEVDNYDYTVGYPEKLNFEVPME